MDHIQAIYCTVTDLIISTHKYTPLVAIMQVFVQYGTITELHSIPNINEERSVMTRIRYINTDQAIVAKENVTWLAKQQSMTDQATKVTKETKDQPKDNESMTREITDEVGRRIHVLVRHDEDEEDVYTGLKKFGLIEYLYIIQDGIRGKRAFICYERKEDAEKAIGQTQDKYRARAISPQRMTGYEGPLKRKH